MPYNLVVPGHGTVRNFKLPVMHSRSAVAHMSTRQLRTYVTRLQRWLTQHSTGPAYSTGPYNRVYNNYQYAREYYLAKV